MYKYHFSCVAAILAISSPGWAQNVHEAAASLLPEIPALMQDEEISFELGIESDEDYDKYFRFGGILAQDLEVREDEFGEDIDATFDDAQGFSLAFGWDMFEIELSYFTTDDVDTATNSFFSTTDASGEAEIVSIMFNLILDGKFGGGFGGYVGAGLGIAFIDYNITQVSGGSSLFTDATEVAFAYQLMFGLTFDIPSNERFELYVGARVQFADGINFEIETEIRMIEFGLRIHF